MYQGRILRVTDQVEQRTVQIALNVKPHIASPSFLLEIVVDRGDFLSVPNEALIDEGGHQIVYVKQSDGEFEAKPVQIGIQGELYSQVLEGVRDGEQVVTGSEQARIFRPAALR